MIRKIIIQFQKIFKIKFRFDFPSTKKIILFDGLHASTLREIIKKDFAILNIRDEKEVYFWIYIKQIITLDFKFHTYCINYIKFVSPKVVITFTDNNIQFYKLKKNFNDIIFISVQNGNRDEKNYDFHNKENIKFKKLKCDHIFVFNKYYKKQYQKVIDSNYHILGNFRNNIVKIEKTKIKDEFLLISQFGKDYENNNFLLRLLNFINLYFVKFGKKIHILLRNKSSLTHKEEMKFYNKIFGSNCVFYKTFTPMGRWKKTYSILDKFENIIFMYSTLGFEAIARKKKVAVFSHWKDSNSEFNFAMPAPFQNKYNFFSLKNLTYNDVKRVLDNIYNCKQEDWEKKYYKIAKQLMHFDKNNTLLRKVIIKSYKKF